MNILVTYATNSSGTQTASKVIATKLTEHQHAITHKDIREVNPDELQNFDLVVIGSPSWDYTIDHKRLEGQPHEFMRAFIEKMQGKKLYGKKFAVFGLGDTAFMQFCGAVDHMEEMVKNAEGQLVTESLRIDGFYFDQSNNEKKVAEWADNFAQKLN